MKWFWLLVALLNVAVALAEYAAGRVLRAEFNLMAGAVLLLLSTHRSRQQKGSR